MASSIPLYHWISKPKQNFGDAITKPIVEWISGHNVTVIPREKPKKLLAIGSILQSGCNGDIVWGSGVHPTEYDSYWQKRKPRRRKWYKPTQKYASDLEVWAVRGPLTRDALLHQGIPCPEVFGDPAILLPLVYPREPNPQQKFGIVTHYRDENRIQSPNISVINALEDWKTVVDEILKCEVIISSSLHGIIVAEAYGVPAIWLRTLSGEGYVKYADYYLGTGRNTQPYYSLDEALKGKPQPIPSSQRDQLINAFNKKGIERILVNAN